MDILTITIKDRRKKNQTLKRTETQGDRRVRRELKRGIANLTNGQNSSIRLKVPEVYVTRNFVLAYSKELSKWWRKAFIGSPSYSDFDLRKWDDVTLWTQNDLKWNISEDFWCKELKNCSCYTHHEVPWYVHCHISMATQWAPGPLHSKGIVRGFLLQGV